MVIRPPSNTDDFTPEELQEWFLHEIYSVNRAAGLRLREAAAFVSDFTSGKLTPDEALQKQIQYDSRWGDSPVPGVHVEPSKSDEQIIKELDRVLFDERHRRSRGGLER